MSAVLACPNVVVDLNRPSKEQMQEDERLAARAEPVARLFTWDPSAVSLGRSQPIPMWLKLAQQAGLTECVRRPTAGGLAFHGSDVSIAVVAPRGVRLHPLLRFMCELCMRLCESQGVDAQIVDAPGNERIECCLTATSSPFSVLIEARKVAGFAIRRYPESFLVQGSLLVACPSAHLLEAMPSALLEEFQQRAMPLLGWQKSRQEDAAAEIAKRWALMWTESWQQFVEIDAL